MSITVRGVLRRDAEHRIAVGDRHQVWLLVEPYKADMHPYHVCLDLRDDHSRAGCLSSQWKRYDDVVFEGCIKRLRTDHDVSAFIVGDLSQLTVRGAPVTLP